MGEQRARGEGEVLSATLGAAAEAQRAVGAVGRVATDKEKECSAKAYCYLKAQLKKAGVGYKELADCLNQHGMEETETSITGKLARGAFAVSFLFAYLAVPELKGVRLESL